MKALTRHVCVVLAALFAALGVPALALGFPGGVDAVSRATAEIPEKPSGELLVYLNPERHPGTAAEWEDFFAERPVEVIMDDVSCMVIDGDAAGAALAERYQARLAENQMSIRRENGLLVAGRAERRIYDVIVASKETAEALALNVPGARTVAVNGGGA